MSSQNHGQHPTVPYTENAADAEYLSAHTSIYNGNEEELHLNLGYGQQTDEDEFYCGTSITPLVYEYSDHDEDDQDPNYWGAGLSHDSSPTVSSGDDDPEYDPVADDNDEYEANNYDTDASEDLLPSTPRTKPPKPLLPSDPAPNANAPPPPNPAPHADAPPPPDPAPNADAPPPLDPAPHADTPPPPVLAPDAETLLPAAVTPITLTSPPGLELPPGPSDHTIIPELLRH